MKKRNVIYSPDKTKMAIKTGGKWSIYSLRNGEWDYIHTLFGKKLMQNFITPYRKPAFIMQKINTRQYIANNIEEAKKTIIRCNMWRYPLTSVFSIYRNHTISTI